MGTNVLDLALKYVELKKVSSKKGGEWQGPCPGCGETGHDPKTGPSNRFHVWPEDNNGTGSYWCRRCGKGGDNIQFLRDFEGLGFKAACERLRIGVGSLGRRPIDRKKQPEAFVPRTCETPADLWIEKATKLLQWSQASLAENTEIMQWLSARGIGGNLAIQAGIGWNPGEKGRDIFRPRQSWGLDEVLNEDGKPKKLWIPMGLVIPLYIDNVLVRLRIRRFDDTAPRYYVIPGSSPATMVIGEDRPAFVVVESELDAILCSLHPCAGAVALGSVSTRPDDRAYKILRDSKGIMVGLDFDKAGGDAFKWWADQFRHAVRWPTPKGKDPGEAYQAGVDIYEYIDRGLTPAARLYMPKQEPAQPPAPEQEKAKAQATAVTTAPGATQYIGVPDAVRELHQIMLRNPGIVIVNHPDRYTVLRNGKYVGGRISELLFRTPEVLTYISNHPDKEITAKNLIKRKDL
ncbi:MAG: CHC2 zinc finger domain-containing protein [Candidatus Paceibacterota bacterium]|jgi:hypothetical protein